MPATSGRTFHSRSSEAVLAKPGDNLLSRVVSKSWDVAEGALMWRGLDLKKLRPDRMSVDIFLPFGRGQNGVVQVEGVACSSGGVRDNEIYGAVRLRRGDKGQQCGG